MSLIPFYLPDEQVDETLDAELRTLLSLCFGKEFEHKRYAYEMPPHRWLVRDKGVLVAHVAVHDKTFQSGEKRVPFLGVAEVCVAPNYRGRGLVKIMLRHAEARLGSVPFAVLLGDPEVYGSSGYRTVGNVYFPHEGTGQPNTGVMVKALRSQLWLAGKVTIEGPPF